MDAEFLKRTVGDPLSEALTSLVMEQPADPIEFIGEALLDYVRRREEEAKVGGEIGGDRGMLRAESCGKDFACRVEL